VRITPLLLAFGLCVFVPLPAQDPGAQQDAEAAREKLLKAEDELDNIQANSESTKTSVDGMKTDVATLQADVTKLQSDNAALTQQLAALQSAFDEYKADQIQARQTLIDNVAGMIAAGKAAATKSHKKKEAPSPDADANASSSPPSDTANPPGGPSSLTPPPDAPAASSSTDAARVDSPPPVKPRKGYYHVVASGETLTMICAAYRANGVSVTVSEIRKANGLTEDSTLKTGQKLFIPKPGT
jgi:LysM repeat protein